MANYKTIRQVTFDSARHTFTGNTTHYHGQEQVPIPSTLCIVQFPNDIGYYLLHFDASGNELTDTYHDSLDDAVDQANWEFRIEPHEWEDVG